MLISRDWTVLLTFVRSLYPVPSSVTVATKTPGILQATLISCPSSKANHHACGTSSLTECSRVIHSYLWSFSSAIELNPREWSFFNTEAPHIIHCFLTGVSSENKKMWLRENDRMTVSPTWSRSHHWNNHPLGLIFSISHIEQVEIITGERTSTSSSSIYYHLHLLNIGGGVGCSW